MDLAFVALRLRVWNLLFNLFILRHADYRYVDISLPIVLFCFFLFKFTQSRNPVDAATIRRRGERFLTSKSGRGHGVFHSKGDRPRGGTGGLRIRLCHHDLHDRKHPGAPARPVPRRRGPDRHLTPVSPPAGGITPPRTCAASRRCAPGSWPGSASRSSPARSGRFARWRSLLWPFSSPSRSPCTPTNKYLSENKRALILRSALSCLYAKAHYRPAS